MTISAAQLLVTVGANTLPAKTQILGLAGMLGSGGVLAAGAVAAGAVMVGVGVVAAHMAADFQTGLTSLVTGAGESTKNLGMVRQGILQLAQDTGTSTKQLIDGMYMIESGGFHGAAGLAILKAAAEGAKVGNADLGVVADATDTILKNFGEGGALTATQATNALITTVANGKVHLEDLASSLAMVLPAGAAAGLGLKDVLGAMAEMTNVGVPAAESATYLRQMIIALEAPSAGARSELAKIGITTKELGAAMKKGLPDALQLIQDQLAKHGIKQGTAEYVAALREISGGTRQMQGMLNLMGPHLQDFKDKVAKVGGAASATGTQVQGWALVQQTANQQLSRAKESVMTLLIQLGTHLLPIVTAVAKFFADNLPGAIHTFQTAVGPVVSKVGELVGKLTENKPLMKTLGEAFERLQPLIGPVLTGLAILTAITFAPLALAVGILVGLIVVLTHLPEIIGTVAGALGNFFGTIFGAIGTAVGNLLGTLGNFFGTIFGAIGSAVGGFFSRTGAMIQTGMQVALSLFTTPIHAVVNLFKFLFDHNYYFHDLVVGIQREFTNARDFITNLWTGIQHWLGQQWERIKADAMLAWVLVQAYVVKPVEQAIALVQAKIGQARNWIMARWDDIKADAQKAWTRFTDLIGNAVTLARTKIGEVVAAIMKPVTDLGQKLFDAGKNLIQMLINGIKSMAGNVGQTASNIAGQITKFLGFHSPAEEGPGSTADQWMPNLVKMLSVTLTQSAPQLEVAANSAAGAVAMPFMGAPNRAVGGSAGASAAGQPLVININIDGKRAAQAIWPHLPAAIRNATGARNF